MTRVTTGAAIATALAAVMASAAWRMLPARATTSSPPQLTQTQMAAGPGQPAPADDDGRRPKLVVDQDTFDFGTMNVGDSGQHVFVLRNEGNADLTIEGAGTSCQCTLLEAPDGRIPPRHQRQVRVEWTAEKPTERFRHGAVLVTNDPDQRRVRLVLVGRVRTFLGHFPDSVTFTDVAPGEERTAQVTVFSQAWDALQITGVETVMPSLSWQIEPADPATLASLGARSGYSLRVTLAPDVPKGPFVSRLRVNVRTDQVGLAPQPAPLEVPVYGNKLGVYSFYGDIVHSSGCLDLGPLAQGQGAKRAFYMHVRGEHQDLDIREVHVQPGFVRLKVERDDRVRTKRSRYKIEIEIPPDAPLVDCMGASAGRFELLTDHPVEPRVGLKVEFAVHP